MFYPEEPPGGTRPTTGRLPISYAVVRHLRNVEKTMLAALPAKQNAELLTALAAITAV